MKLLCGPSQVTRALHYRYQAGNKPNDKGKTGIAGLKQDIGGVDKDGGTDGTVKHEAHDCKLSDLSLRAIRDARHYMPKRDIILGE